MSSEVHCLDLFRLERFLERRRARPTFRAEAGLAESLIEILHKANEFVPSEGGALLLDDPTKKHEDRSRNTLAFIATFGQKSRSLIGRKMSVSDGIAGHVYLTGRAYHTADAQSDAHFYREIDEETQLQTRSIAAIPIRIGKEVCGVLELLRREGAYSEDDCKLLEIFAGYISISIENVLDTRQAQEIAKKDNLTDLFNDRYLHIALANAIADCRQGDSDMAVLFLDLDFFKRVNDTHGHLAGSQVLREVGHLLRHAVREPEGIAARYGGDEFVLALPGVDLTTAVDRAEDIRSQVVTATFCTKPGAIQPEPLHLTGVTCSIGVATLKRHITDDLSVERCKTTLLHLADAAMYVAKETGRNRTAVAGEPVRRRSLTPSGTVAESGVGGSYRRAQSTLEPERD